MQDYRIMTIDDYEAAYDLWIKCGNGLNDKDDSREGIDKYLRRNPGTSFVAIVDGKIAGTAGIESVGEKYKVKHRAEFGIGILKEYWGLGLGKALTKACIQCAIDAGYEQLELNVIAENERALSLYRSLGFIEYGRNPRGFNSKISGYQELVYMLLEL